MYYSCKLKKLWLICFHFHITENQFLFHPPNRYIFPGAEVYTFYREKASTRYFAPSMSSSSSSLSDVPGGDSEVIDSYGEGHMEHVDMIDKEGEGHMENDDDIDKKGEGHMVHVDMIDKEGEGYMENDDMSDKKGEGHIEQEVVPIEQNDLLIQKDNKEGGVSVKANDSEPTESGNSESNTESKIVKGDEQRQSSDVTWICM